MTVKLIRNTQLGLSLNKHIAVGDIGVPRYWVTVWEALNGHNFRPSTLAKRLSAIDQFYNFTTELAGGYCLDSIIASGNFDVLEQYLEAFFIHIRNTSSQTNQNHANRWLFVLDFARDLMFRLSGTSTDEGTLLDLRRKIRRLDQLYASFRPKRQAKQQKIRALPASVIEELYLLTDPTSEKKPFRSVSQRWRNQALFLLYPHLGLRRAETLVRVNVSDEKHAAHILFVLTARAFCWPHALSYCLPAFPAIGVVAYRHHGHDLCVGRIPAMRGVGTLDL